LSNGLQLSVKARQTLRARAKTGVLMTPPAQWDDWLTTLFPAHFKAGFAERHVEMWEWEESIVPGKRPRPFIAIWGRGGAKSTSAEAVVVKLGAREVRKYVWYVSSIQDKADQHVASIGEMLEADNLSRYYPALTSRRVGKYGASKGWRRERLSTDSGLTIDALGLDTGSRGAKIGSQRPDVIALDDIDELGDSLATVLKKIDILTKTILPAGSSDCAILFIQNLIHPESIASRLVDGRADFLSERIISGPYPAIEGLTYEQRGGKFVITGGKATWEGQSLKICQQNIWDWGLTAFLQEAQHDIDRSSGLWSHIDFDSIHVAPKDMPAVIRTVVWVDPAVTSTDESDNQGIQADSLCADGRIYRRFSWEGIDSPENTLEHAIKKALELHADTVGVEDDQGGDTWQSVYKIACQEIKKEFKKEGKEIREFPRFAHNRTTDTKNEQRVETGSSVVSKVARNSRMLTAYENDKIRHVLGTHTFLERALNRFPRKPLDLADASFWSWRDLDLGLSIVGEEELANYGKDEISHEEITEDMIAYHMDTFSQTHEEALKDMMKEREKI